MKVKVILVFIIYVLICPLAIASDFYAHCYWTPQGTRKTIAINLLEKDVGTEFQVRRIESGKTLYSGVVVGDRITIKFNTPGHNVIYARTYKIVDGLKVFGEWMNSLQEKSSIVMIGPDWIPRPWVIIVPTIN